MDVNEGTADSEARLRVERGPAAGREAVLPLGSLIIGRSADAGLPLRDKRASRHHACLTRSPAGLLVEDLGAANRTQVNGNPVFQPTPLYDGDELRIGDSVLRVLAPAWPRPAVAKSQPATAKPPPAAPPQAQPASQPAVPAADPGKRLAIDDVDVDVVVRGRDKPYLIHERKPPWVQRRLPNLGLLSESLGEQSLGLQLLIYLLLAVGTVGLFLFSFWLFGGCEPDGPQPMQAAPRAVQDGVDF